MTKLKTKSIKYSQQFVEIKECPHSSIQDIYEEGESVKEYTFKIKPGEGNVRSVTVNVPLNTPMSVDLSNNSIKQIEVILKEKTLAYSSDFIGTRNMFKTDDFFTDHKSITFMIPFMQQGFVQDNFTVKVSTDGNCGIPLIIYECVHLTDQVLAQNKDRFVPVIKYTKESKFTDHTHVMKFENDPGFLESIVIKCSEPPRRIKAFIDDDVLFDLSTTAIHSRMKVQELPTHSGLYLYDFPRFKVEDFKKLTLVFSEDEESKKYVCLNMMDRLSS